MSVVLLDESVLQRQTATSFHDLSIADPAFSESLLVTVKADVLFGRRSQGSGTATRNKLWNGNGGLDESQQQRFLNLLNQDPASYIRILVPHSSFLVPLSFLHFFISYTVAIFSYCNIRSADPKSIHS